MYKHVKYLDISSNLLADISLLAGFEALVTLNAGKNQIASMALFERPGGFPNLQVLNLSGNKITELSSVSLPQLIRLTLD